MLKVNKISQTENENRQKMFKIDIHGDYQSIS